MTEDKKGLIARLRERAGEDLYWAAGLGLLSLAVMTVYSLSAHPELHPDFERYVGVAQGIAAFDLQRAFHFHYPPLYPLMLAILDPILGSYEAAARTINVITTGLTVIPLYFIALLLFGRRAAVLTGLLFALRFFDKNSIVKAEQPGIMFIYLGVLLGFVAMRDGGWKRHLAAGVAFGLAFLTKAEASAYFFAFIGLSVFELGWQMLVGKRQSVVAREPESKKKKKKAAAEPSPAPAITAGPRVIALAIAVAGYFVVTGPYLISYTAATGKVSLSPKTGTLFKIHNYLYGGGALYALQRDDSGYFTYAQRIYIDGDRAPINLDNISKPSTGQFLKTYFQRLGQNVKKHLAGWYLQPMLPWLWVPLLLLGLWPHIKGGRWRQELYLTAYGVIPVFTVPLFSSSYERFFFTMAPWLMIVFAAGANRALELTLDRAGADTKAIGEKVGLVVVAAVLLVLAGMEIAHPAKPGEAVDPGVEFRRQVGQNLREVVKGDCRFIAEMDKPSIWYLAGLRMDQQEVLPVTDMNGLVALARDRKAKYLFLHNFRFPGRFAALQPLLRPDFNSPDFRPVFRAMGPGGDPHVIYEIAGVQCGE